MKKYMTIIFSFILTIIIASCNLPKSDVSNTVVEYTPIEKGQQITNDLFELSIEKTMITKAADSSDLGISKNLYESDGNIYFILFGKVKNVSSSTISFTNMTNVHLSFDDKYEYEVSTAPSDLSNLIPLKTESFLWYSSVPIEVLDSTNDFKFRWDILSNTGSGQTQARYSLSGHNAQYLSAENIDNFNVFAEVIRKIAENTTTRPATITLEDDGKYKSVIISSKAEILFLLPHDRRDNSRIIYMTPRISFLYNSFDHNEAYGTLEFYFSGIGKKYFVVLKTLTISSDTGSMDIIFPLSDYDEEWAYFSHDLWKVENLVELSKIVNGNNLHFIVTYADASLDKDAEKVRTDLITSTDIEDINNLLSIYAACPDSPFQLP